MASANSDLSAQVQIRRGPPGLAGLPLDQQQILLLLNNKLLPLLPYSITVARRIQFELRHPSPTAQIYLATVTADTPSSRPSQVISDITTWLSQYSDSPPPPQEPFIAAYIDLFPAGSTQVFVFASWEIPDDHRPPFPGNSPPSPPPHPITAPPDNPNLDPTHSLLIETLLTHINTHLIPLRPQSPPDDWLWLRDNKKYLSQPYSTSKVLFGATHALVAPFLAFNGTTRRVVLYLKSIFPPTSSTTRATAPSSLDGSTGTNTPGSSLDSAAATDNDDSNNKPALPPMYTLATLTDADLHTVLSRSPIPRTIRTLRRIVNAGIYYSNRQKSQKECIAWGFLSADGSVISLHVEPSHRGLGLAGILTAELLRRLPGAFATPTTPVSSASEAAAAPETQALQQQWYGHADVEDTNSASQRVMEKLGARVWFGVQWVEIDVGMVLAELQQRKGSAA